MGLRRYLNHQKEAWGAARSALRASNASGAERDRLWQKDEEQYGPFEDGPSSGHDNR